MTVLTQLSLNQFRCYTDKKFELHPHITVLVGPNAVGKTNVIEAIHMVSLGKSFRATKDEEMIAFGKDLGRVEAQTEGDQIEIVLTRGIYQGKRVAKKKFKINFSPKRRKDIVGRLRVVLFEPQDLDIVIGSPSRRRSFLDHVLSQAHSQYFASITVYQKAMKRRNKLLSLIFDHQASLDQIAYWDDLLIKEAATIQYYRQAFIDHLNQLMASDRYLALLQPTQLPRSEIHFEYEPKTITKERLLHYRQAELAIGKTLIGPHRDNFNMFQKLPENSRNMATFGSRGEQRMVALALKLGELAYLRNQTQDKPVLLLDDIFSELDYHHKQVVLDMADNQQTIITTTDLDYLQSVHKESLHVIFLGEEKK